MDEDPLKKWFLDKGGNIQKR